MTDINTCVLIGRITRDLNEKSFAYTSGGTARANISIACNRSRKQGDQWVDEVSYFDVTIWGKQAESLKPYLTKGKQIAVEGYLKQERWEKDGQKNSRVSITAVNVQLLGGDKKTSNNEQQESHSQNYSDNSFPEDIPF